MSKQLWSPAAAAASGMICLKLARGFDAAAPLQRRGAAKGLRSIEALGRRAVALAADPTRRSAGGCAVVRGKSGRPLALVNNAGVTTTGSSCA